MDRKYAEEIWKYKMDTFNVKLLEKTKIISKPLNLLIYNMTNSITEMKLNISKWCNDKCHNISVFYSVLIYISLYFVNMVAHIT